VANTGLARRDERYEFRMTSSDRALFERAADLQGLKLSEFVLDALRERAQTALRENDVIILNGEDRKSFVEALMNPPRLNARLRRALVRHRESAG
jgi:uncharacterized protein (DUF1778 family)